MFLKVTLVFALESRFDSRSKQVQEKAKSHWETFLHFIYSVNVK